MYQRTRNAIYVGAGHLNELLAAHESAFDLLVPDPARLWALRESYQHGPTYYDPTVYTMLFISILDRSLMALVRDIQHFRLPPTAYARLSRMLLGVFLVYARAPVPCPSLLGVLDCKWLEAKAGILLKLYAKAPELCAEVWQAAKGLPALLRTTQEVVADTDHHPAVQRGLPFSELVQRFARRHGRTCPLFEAANDRLGQAQCIVSLGSMDGRLDRYGDAKQQFKTAQKLVEATGNRHGQVLYMQSLADMELSLIRNIIGLTVSCYKIEPCSFPLSKVSLCLRSYLTELLMNDGDSIPQAAALQP